MALTKQQYKELGFNMIQSHEPKEIFCRQCDDQLAYDVFILSNGERRIGVRQMVKEFGLQYHSFYELQYRERCPSCYSKFEREYLALQSDFKKSKEANDAVGMNDARTKMKAMLAR